MPFIVLDTAAAAAAPVTTLGAPLSNQGMTLEATVAELDALVMGRIDITQGRLEEWINESYIDLYTSLDFDPVSFQLPIVADQPLYLLPDTIEAVHGVSLVLPETENPNGGYPLDPISRGYYRTLAVDEGDPKLFFTVGVKQKMLVVYPTPDTTRTLSLDVTIRPAKLTLAQHSPILPIEWHEAIKQGARQRVFSAMELFDKSDRSENDQLKLVRKRKDPEALTDVGRTFGSSAPHKAYGIRNTVRGFRNADD